MVRGGDVYISVKPKALPQPTPMRQHEHVAIAGAGAAALAACVTLRESGFEGRITMISPEARKPYDRTALSKSTLAAAPEDIEIPPCGRRIGTRSTVLTSCMIKSCVLNMRRAPFS